MDNPSPDPWDSGQSPPPAHFPLVAALFEGGLVVVAVLLGRLLGHPPTPEIHWTAQGVVWGAAASLPLMALLLLGVKFPVWPFADVLRVVEDLLVPLFRDCRLLVLAEISILAGVGEEMLFRGVLQEAVAGWVGGAPGPWVGLAVASLLFGMAHLITPAYGLLAGLIGLYLGWLWIYSGNLLVPITAHAAYDFLALAYLARRRSGDSESHVEKEEEAENGTEETVDRDSADQPE